jgi:hypothetical protein
MIGHLRRKIKCEFYSGLYNRHTNAPGMALFGDNVLTFNDYDAL